MPLSPACPLSRTRPEANRPTRDRLSFRAARKVRRHVAESAAQRREAVGYAAGPEVGAASGEDVDGGVAHDQRLLGTAVSSSSASAPCGSGLLALDRRVLYAGKLDPAHAGNLAVSIAVETNVIVFSAVHDKRVFVFRDQLHQGLAT